MNHIGGLFNKIKDSFDANNRQKHIVIDVYKRIVGGEIDSGQIVIERNVLKLAVNPSAKSVVFMKKQQLLDELNKELKPALTDIR